jgi:hypothetical protein
MNRVRKSAQRRKVYSISANDLNSQQLAFASTVNIGSGDMLETCGDPSLRLDFRNQSVCTASIGEGTKDARLSYERDGHGE